MAAHNLQGSFSVSSGEFAFETVSHSRFAVFDDYFLSAVWARVRFQRAWVNSLPERRFELALVASDEREVWEKKYDKTSAAIAFVIGLWELVQPWVLLQGNSHMPWLHGIAGYKTPWSIEAKSLWYEIGHFLCQNALLFILVLTATFWPANCKEITAIAFSQLFPVPFLHLGKFHLNFLSALHHSKSDYIITEPQCRSQTFAWSSLTHRSTKRENQDRKHLYFGKWLGQTAKQVSRIPLFQRSKHWRWMVFAYFLVLNTVDLKV